MSLEILAI